MGEPARHQKQDAYRTQPFWLRPYWWLWTGGCASLILVLGLGAPLLCVVHCALMDITMAHTSLLAATADVPCTIGAPLPANQHIPLQAIFPALLVTALSIAWWPIMHTVPARALLRMQPWVVPPTLPPPRTDA